MAYNPKIPNEDLDSKMEDLLKDLGDYRSDLDDYEDDELYEDWLDEEDE